MSLDRYVLRGAAAIVLAALPLTSGAQEHMGAHPPRPDPCGSGTLSVRLDGADSGEERYTVDCAEYGTTRARGHSVISLGGMSADYVVVMELDAQLVPRLVTATGTSSSGPIDDTLVLEGAASTLTRNGAKQQIAAAEGAAYVGNNLFWPVALLLSRYDVGRGGRQQVPVFPALMATLEYQHADTIAPVDPTFAPHTFHRYSLALGSTPIVVWTDDHGRMAAIMVAPVRLLVTDTRHAAYADALAKAGGVSGASLTTPPDYSAHTDAAFTAEEVAIDAGDYSLAGTLLLPKGARPPYPAALTITGSGQQTRDSRLPIPGLEAYAPFREVAERLASAGIAVLRVDDRGVGGSTGAQTLESATTSSFADDVRAQLRFLRARRDIDGARLALIGHSEGALIAPIVASSDSTVAALVLMAGTAARGDSVLREQMEDLLSRDVMLSDEQRNVMREQQRTTLRRLAAGEPVPGVAGAAWLREFIAHDPLESIARVRQPVLILHGERDRQVLAHHARAIARTLTESGNTNATLRIFPRLNHLFLPSATGAVSEYGTLERQSLPDEVLTTITEWLARTLRAHAAGAAR